MPPIFELTVHPAGTAVKDKRTDRGHTGILGGAILICGFLRGAAAEDLDVIALLVGVFDKG